MSKAQWGVYLLLAGMLFIPFARLMESVLEASPARPTLFRADLLLKPGLPAPAFDQINRLERPVIATYIVQGRQDLWSICRRFHVDPFAIRSSNDLDVSVFSGGTVLKIPNRKGTLYEVRTPETLRTISQGYKRGRDLGSAYEREILVANDFPRPDLKDPNHPFEVGTVLFLPEALKPTGLLLPFLSQEGSYRQTSRFGRRRHPVSGEIKAHHGLDLAKPYGSPVHTSREGVVTFTGWKGGYGQMVEIRHVIKRKSGTRVLYTRYGHLSNILVHEGQRVRLYQLIGCVGSTGISTGPHLHFEVRDESGRASNPRNFL